MATRIYGDDDDVRFRSHSFFPIPPRSIVGSIVAILIEAHLLQAISLHLILVMDASAAKLVLLSSLPTPQPDRCDMIRCCCIAECRRRCPVGRLRACMMCSTSVGPCCGFLAIDDSLGATCPLRGFVVCHVCLFGRFRSRCMWSPLSRISRT